ncbi:uncharacterized protein N7483_007880 [Penicillium malachiteum]|uniref:uncharacterized protein n=1 Tax=Penicillium malachiteum TaxID=1324776 RepID=UPI00254966C5|nr:uncharacterized protein N7483_007880 [Penicillium malachiteum]KAJ5726523.1 hypothetical protein N7483_007880 [Penicillium malachiteum]
MENSQPSKSPGPIFMDHLINQLSQFQAPEQTIEDLPRTQRGTQLEEKPPNPLSALPASQLAQVKPLMLTIHSLFPNDLLPALDILDRGLVQRFIREDRMDDPTAPSHSELEHSRDQEMTMNPSQNLKQNTKSDTSAQSEDIFFVISASSAPLPKPPGTSSPSTPGNVPPQTQTQTQTQEQIKGYEVRLHAWNCTCPTFALSAFRDPSRLNHQFEYPSGIHIADPDQSGNVYPYPYPFGGTLTSVRDRASPPICKHILACLLFIRCPGLFGGCGDGRCIISKEELAGWCAGFGG